MALPDLLAQSLLLPVIASPMFLISNPALVIAQCKAGIVGSFPALNARPKEHLDIWLTQIEEGLDGTRKADPTARVAPYAVNLIVHQSNDRLEHDLAVSVSHKVPIIITSLRAPGDVARAVHSYGGLVFHDVTTVRHAEKSLEDGVDGLILVCAGAGGHAGTLSPFAFIGEVRRFYSGTLILAGAIANGSAILAARAMGADLAYMGTRFIASTEAAADPRYKQMIVDSKAADIVYTPYFTGIHGNYLIPSITTSGLDIETVRQSEKPQPNFRTSRVTTWKEVWGAGQSVGVIDGIVPAGDIVDRLAQEYTEALKRLLT